MGLWGPRPCTGQAGAQHSSDPHPGLHMPSPPGSARGLSSQLSTRSLDRLAVPSRSATLVGTAFLCHLVRPPSGTR